MIKVFNPTDTDYTSNGEVILLPTKCRVFNADNGEFKLEITSPIKYSPYLVNNNIIVTPTPSGVQPFRIYDVKRKHSSVDIKARHITYDSLGYVIANSYIKDHACQYALTHLNAATDTPSPFTMSSDITRISTYRCVRKSLKEAVDEVASRWQGHIVRNGFHIAVKDQIGVDNGITIEYGKNLKSLTADYDFSNVCTKILPVGKDGQLLDELYIVSDVDYGVPFTRVVSFTQEIDREDYQSDAAYIRALKRDLRKQANNYLATYKYPNVNYTLNGKPEKVSDIGDIIRVYDKTLGIDITTQVISYEFDAITESYKSLQFGNFQKTLGDLIGVITEQVKQSL